MKKSEKNLYLGISAAVCGACMNALMAALIKIEAERNISTSLIILWRAIWALSLLIPIIYFSKPRFTFSEKIKTTRYGMHFIRGVTGFIGVFLFFFVLKDLSLTVASLLFFTIPLFMPFVARIWKKTPLPRLGWIGLALGFIGVVCVIKPGHQLFHPAALLGLLSGIVITISQFSAHLLTETESNQCINFYYFWVMILLALPLTFLFGLGWKSLSPIDFLLLFGIGLFALAYVLFLTLALKHGSPPLVTSFLYTVVIFTMILDWWIWKKTAHALTWIGTILIITGVLLKFFLHKKETIRD